MATTHFDSADGLVFTSRQVLEEGWPVLLVTHDADDGAWQFVNGHGDTDDDRNVIAVPVQKVVDLDPTVGSLSTLPVGWAAWRPAVGAEWERGPFDDPV